MSQDLERALDGYLAASARTGDRRALGALASRWTPRLSAFAWRLMGDADGVEEAVQDSWVEILKDLPRLRDVDAFPAFAFRIVQRRCARLIRQRQSGRRLKADAQAEPPPESHDPDRAVDALRIREAMRDLPPEQHAALWLYHIQGLNVAEIAAALDVPTGTIKTRLMHARRKIAAQLQGGSDE
ncbi:MAG: RNA polymerase sigma factor [Oceanicaulis sp.]|jgi:RNA polymerase sigma factor (sigma-70 family)|uniref:RNA polymerase sigma factor n=1 Tax=Oceanicaulis TaxID=153232 RepID=UPI0003B68940|nr:MULTISPECIES: RNA polymerase sigma factor [Oceanicaulis]MAP48662.1 RNA polymerase sigma factor [Oceanicaulis sp.]HCR65251.1 RNA polymerase sigma factor [Oceanicaulis sp.]|tara:strand:- start:673 stop:1224 length:552 start_codon:yes stop_codon:yes gene_type:complete